MSPHLEEDAYLFKGEGADGGLVFHAGFFELVENFGRRCFMGTSASGLVGAFVEGLFEQLGAGVSAMDRFGVAALLGDTWLIISAFRLPPGCWFWVSCFETTTRRLNESVLSE